MSMLARIVAYKWEISRKSKIPYNNSPKSIYALHKLSIRCECGPMDNTMDSIEAAERLA